MSHFGSVSKKHLFGSDIKIISLLSDSQATIASQWIKSWRFVFLVSVDSYLLRYDTIEEFNVDLKAEYTA